MPTTWQSTKWWRNRPPADRLFFIKSPKRYTDYDGEFNQFVLPDEFTLGDNYVVLGKTKTGKSVSSVKTVEEIVEIRNLSARFVSTDEYVEMLKDTFDNDGDLPEMWSSPHLVKYIKGVFDILILDGLGEERDTEFAKHEIGSLIRRRYEMGLTTIITTGMSITDITNRYGTRVSAALDDYKRIHNGR